MKVNRQPPATDEFVPLVSHEIKNALTSVAGFSQLAQEAIRDHDDSLALENLDIVRLETARIFRLVEDLLDLAQVTAGKFSVRMEQVDLEKIVWDVASRYSRPTRRQIDVSVTENYPRVLGDALRLTQVLENLLSNATKYSPMETTIRIALSGSDSSLILSVWNDGTAIPADEMPHVFQKFSRGTNMGHADLTTTPIRGHGLGLFISKQIAELHGGSMSVLSEEGSGTTFTVQLPRHPPPPDGEPIHGESDTASSATLQC